MTTYEGEEKIARLLTAPNPLAQTFREAFRTANRKGRCRIVGIVAPNFGNVVLALREQDKTEVQQLLDGRLVWKGGVILIPFYATQAAEMQLPQWSQLMFINDAGEVIYGL